MHDAMAVGLRQRFARLKYVECNIMDRQRAPVSELCGEGTARE